MLISLYQDLKRIPLTEASSASLAFATIFLLYPSALPSLPSLLNGALLLLALALLAELLLDDTSPDAAYEAALKLVRAILRVLAWLSRALRCCARSIILCVVEVFEGQDQRQDEDEDQQLKEEERWQDEEDQQPTVDVVQQQQHHAIISIGIIASLLASTHDAFLLLNLRRRQAASILYAIAYLSLARLMPSPSTTAPILLLLSSLRWACRWILLPLGIIAWLHFCLATFILHWGELEALCLCVASLSWVMSRLDKT